MDGRADRTDRTERPGASGGAGHGTGGSGGGAGELAGRLHGVAIRLLRRVRGDDPVTGLSPARLSALSVLVFGGSRLLGELAAAEQVTPPTMSRLVSALERDGLVVRRSDAADRRVVRLEATSLAARVLREAQRRRVAHLAGLLGGLAAGDRAVLEEAVSVLERVFGGGTK